MDGVAREFRPVRPRWLAWLAGALGLFSLALGLLEGTQRDWLGLAARLLVVIGCTLQLLIYSRQHTTLHPDGIRVHTGVWPARLIPWSDITDVRVPGRWAPTGQLIRRSGRVIYLPGATEQELRALAEQLDLPVASSPPGGPRTPDGGDLDGPFRSGVTRVTRLPRPPGP